nr:immunoglobulin heavy chain junction region [Mus musculus]
TVQDGGGGRLLTT